MREPWTLEKTSEGWNIKDCNGRVILTDDSANGEYASTIPVEVAEWVVSCANACRGIRKEFLDEGMVEFALINPHIYLKGYDFDKATFEGKEIFEPVK
jgi:hypothetical protein